jgi:hypothetical protein
MLARWTSQYTRLRDDMNRGTVAGIHHQTPDKQTEDDGRE